MKYCKNCGKLINPSTLVCDACGTDYNEEPNCEHFFTDWKYARNPLENSTCLLFKCSKCNKVVLMNCSDDMIRGMLTCDFEV